MNQIAFIDFESYYSTAEGYTLKKISMYEYIKSPKFKAFGLGVKFGGKLFWLSGHDQIAAWVKTVDWANTSICCQNVKFDGAILRWIYGASPKSYIDTLSMSRAVLGCKLSSHSLANVAAHFKLAPKGFLRTDGLQSLTPDQEKELADYCLHDTELCEEIYNRLAAAFPANQYPVMDWTIRCFIDPALVLDAAKLADVHEAEKARRIRIFEDIGIDKKVFSSNVQFPRLLAEKGYECPMKKSPRTGKEIPALSVSDSGFIELRESAKDNPELEALCEARIAAKSTLLETRSAKFLEISKLGLFPFDLNYSGAVNTHRFSGASGAGGNPQNLPRGSALREAVCAPTGYRVLVADFAAIELRVVAWLAREPKLIDPILNGDDIYSLFGSRIYGRIITKADKKERQFGKCAILGLGYNMGAKKFIYQVRSQTGMVIDQAEAERVVGLYRGYYGRVPALWRTLDHYIPYISKGATVQLPGMPFLTIKDGCVMLPSGLRIQYPNLRWEDEEWIYDTKGETSKLYGGKLLENISQALAGEICKVAIERARATGLNVVGQVHDEILCVVPEDQTQKATVKLLEAMETAMPWWPTLAMKAEAGSAANWLKAKG